MDKFEEYMEFLNWKKTHGSSSIADKIKHYTKNIADLNDSKDGKVPVAADAGKSESESDQDVSKAKDNAKSVIDEAVEKIKKEDEKVVEE